MIRSDHEEMYTLFCELIRLSIDNIYRHEIEKALNLIINIEEFYTQIKTNFIDNSIIYQIDKVFNSILDASEKKDYILIADLLQFELNDLLYSLLGLKDND